MIKKSSGKWLVRDSKDQKTLGSHTTKKEALEQLRAIEANKYADGGTVNTVTTMSGIFKETPGKRFKKIKKTMRR